MFVGPNGSGKSNFFEALEFIYYFYLFDFDIAQRAFGNIDSLKPFQLQSAEFNFKIEFDQGMITGVGDFNNNEEMPFSYLQKDESKSIDDYKKGFSRLFINKKNARDFLIGSNRLESDSQNLEDILEHIFRNNFNREEMVEWLKLFIPEFDNLEVKKNELSDNKTLLIYEKKTKNPFRKNLISDGTYNILALLTAIYQSEESQFICIEEPENGLHPYVIRTLVGFFRQQCEEKGHYIWLNTHSQTLVDELRPHEIILVDKKDGSTQTKQIPKETKLHGLKMDFAWLSNALGGGVPW